MSGGGSQSESASTGMPAWLQPYAGSFINSYGRQVFGNSWYPGAEIDPQAMDPSLQQQVAPLTAEQQAAMSGISNLSGQLTNTSNWAGNQLDTTLSGQYLNPATNPYLNATYDQAAGKVAQQYSTAIAPGLAAGAQRAGQFGSSAMNEAMLMSQGQLGNTLNDLATNIYGGNYQQERARQLGAVGLVPQTMQAAYLPSQALMGVGAQKQEQTQAELDAAYANAIAKSEYPFALLSGFGSALGQAGPGGGKSTINTRNQGQFGTHICTELHRQNRMDEPTYQADVKFGASLPPDVVAGYQRWAAPLARAMRRSRLLSALIAPIALEWAKEMRRQIDGEGEGSLIGKIMLRIGVPLCAWLGRPRWVKVVL